MSKKLIIGCGSGRCGTVSLYRLLNSQKNAFCVHESEPLLTWKFDKKLIDNKLEKLLNRQEKYIGDVSSTFLPYLEYIIRQYPDVRVVVLKRDRDEVAKSFIKHSNVFPWSSKYRKNTKWDLMHPVYDIDSKNEALKKYWEDYYEEIGKLDKKYPGRIKVFDTDNLNSRKGVLEILNFCGIDKEDRVVKIKIRKNSSKYPIWLVFLKYLFWWRANKI